MEFPQVWRLWKPSFPLGFLRFRSTEFGRIRIRRYFLTQSFALPSNVNKRRLHNDSVVRIKRFTSRFQIRPRRRRISAKGSTANRTDLPPNNNIVTLMSSRHNLWQIARRASIDRRVNYLHLAHAVFAVFRTRRCWTRNYDEILSPADQQIIEALKERKKGTGN